MSLADLATDLKAQQVALSDNQYLWGVYDIDLVAISDTDRIGDKPWEYVWFNTAGTEELIEHDDELFDALDLLSDGSDFITVDDTNYERLAMLHVPKLITVFFTRQAARRFIDGGRNEFRSPYIEAISLKRNAEMQEVRQLIANTF